MPPNRPRELTPALLALLQEALAQSADFPTLGPTPAINVVSDVQPAGLHVQSQRGLVEERPPEFVPAWMLQVAWDHLTTHGALSNRYLLGELRVMRSSAVCAILARLPGVTRSEGRAVALRYERPRG